MKNCFSAPNMQLFNTRMINVRSKNPHANLKLLKKDAKMSCFYPIDLETVRVP